MGVQLAGGDTVDAPIVAANTDPKRTFLTLLGEEHLPASFAADIKVFRQESASLRMNLALSGLPDFACRPGTDIAAHHRASITFIEEATPLMLIRDTPNAPFSSAELGEGQTIKQAEVARFLNSLINAPIAKVKNAADPAATEVKAHVKSFSFKLFNGEQYTLDIGRKPTLHSHAEASVPHSHLNATPQQKLIL